MVKGLIVAMLLVAVGIARADSPKLAEARVAIDQVRYDDAQRLLVEALAAGGNSPNAIRKIYELAASTAVVLGQREIGEQYYRRWLALDPAAKLPEGSSPKLVDAFLAAQAYMAAHGKLTVSVKPRGPQFDIIVESDPLHMAASATNPGGPVAFVDGRATVTAAKVVLILDDRGNQLLLLDARAVMPAETMVPTEPTGPTVTPLPMRRDIPPRSFSRRWTTWAVPSAAFLVAGGILGALAITQQEELDDVLGASGEHFLSDLEGKHDTVRRNATIGIALAGAGAVLAIPAVVFYLRGQGPRLGRLSLQPVVHPSGFGVAGAF